MSELNLEMRKTTSAISKKITAYAKLWHECMKPANLDDAPLQDKRKSAFLVAIETVDALARRAQTAEQRAERAEEKVGKMLAQLHVSREAAVDVVEQYHKTGVATDYYKILRSVGSATDAIAEGEKP